MDDNQNLGQEDSQSKPGEEKKEMKTSTTPRSLADVASNRSIKEPGTNPLGSGLEARGVHAWFGSKHALKDVTLDFAAGTVTSLIGPSGCGKSTFLRTLNRMHEFIPTAALECA
jgi:phosphate transport system ATP-binding protein